MSEYWTHSSPVILHEEITRRLADPDTKQTIVDALSREPLEFRSFWNGTLAINRLPNELLIQIFIFVMVMVSFPQVFDDDKPLGTLVVTWEWFWRLMGVCRHWREVIVGTPAFWCSVDVRGDRPLTNRSPWTKLCLARSVPAPLDITAGIYSRDGFEAREHLTIIRPLIHRIACLSFETCNIPPELEPDALASLPLLFGDGMPALEGLHFAIGDPEYPYPPYHLPVDVKLTCQRFPRLRRVALARVVAPQEISFYTQLRTLSLTTCSYNLSFDHFLDTLASCTRLQILKLENVVNRLDGGNWMQRDPAAPLQRPLISLPHLIEFRLRGHRAVCTARFLGYFRVAASTLLDVEAEAEDMDEPVDGPSPAGPSSMAAMLPRNHAITLEPLAVARDISMSMLSAGISTWTPPGGALLKMQLIPYGSSVGGRLPRRWGSVADLPLLLGCSPATSLSILYALPDTVAAWADVFRALPLLERLDIDAPSFVTFKPETENAFLGLHTASVTGSDPDCPGPVACPNLSYVGVHGVGSMAVYEAIRTCARYRGDRGLVLAELNIDVSPWGLDHARCLACARDIVDCTGRLKLRGLSLGENQEDETRARERRKCSRTASKMGEQVQ